MLRHFGGSFFVCAIIRQHSHNTQTASINHTNSLVYLKSPITSFAFTLPALFSIHTPLSFAAAMTGAENCGFHIATN